MGRGRNETWIKITVAGSIVSSVIGESIYLKTAAEYVWPLGPKAIVFLNQKAIMVDIATWAQNNFT